MPLRHVQCLASKLFGFIKPCLVHSQLNQRDQGIRDFRAISAKDFLALLERGIQQCVRLVEFAELVVDGSQRVVKLSLYLRLGAKRAGFLHTTIKQRDHSEFSRWTYGFVSTLKQVHHEALDALGTSGLLERGIAGLR